MEYNILSASVKIVEEPHEIYSFPANSASMGNPLSIFYVDDNPIDSWLSVAFFEHYGIANEVVTATNGVDAFKVILEYYEKNLCLPQVVIADLIMPKMDGFDFLKKVEALPFYSKELTKLILITEDMADEDIERAERLQINNVLLKPLDINELYKIIGPKA